MCSVCGSSAGAGTLDGRREMSESRGLGRSNERHSRLGMNERTGNFKVLRESGLWPGEVEDQGEV
ncbi:hypothetical protein HYPSUDRAFT_69962 [Hypholoma sublateritium FD-334 SS-4]|uniref:Uncharacterized protein n=1 Tax=Hypholoma sublateritium (strain FD-334 SS-4) TaxID=945553 RepID=A0A0D2NNT9_HYPSF|nr:hypothetical protein HYPSUDRAFT_69962 [Hypholoma sublateritium FD-334 SS-4]